MRVPAATPSTQVRWLLFGSALRFCAGFTIAVWVVPFYRGRFPTEIGTQFALLKAGVNGVGGAISAGGGGLLTDTLAAKDARAEQWVPALGSLLAVPLWAATLNADSLTISLGYLFAEYLFAECWFGPTVATLQRVAPPDAQGLAQGAFNGLTLVGNLAPLAIGVLVARDFNGAPLELPTLLQYSVGALYVGSAAAFVVAAERVREADRGGDAAAAKSR